MNSESKALSAVLLGVSLMMTAVTAFTVVHANQSDDAGILATFGSRVELESFISKDAALPEGWSLPRTTDDASSSTDESGSGISYSGTNVQVEGVDEDDFVKTDGEHIFVSSGQEVSIVRAYPAETMEELASIPASIFLEGAEGMAAYFTCLFVSGDRLVTIGMVYSTSDWVSYTFAETTSSETIDPTRTMIAVFDISDPSAPDLEFTVGISGYALSCRMIEGTVYAMAQQSTWAVRGGPAVPIGYSNGKQAETDLSTIRYDPETPEATSYVNILAVELEDGDHESLSVLAGWASTIYMSSDSLYLTIQKWTESMVVVDDLVSTEEVYETVTTIYRIDLEGARMSPSASGDVTGWLLSQFSMDEHESHLRVATTTSWTSPENAVYILDEDLRIVGSLEGLAPEERIYSARFVEDRLYLVTFRQVDPLFVIDLSDPTGPAVLGMLEIPGFSTYLHPIDDSHVLGVGQENWTLKLSLFDVSDPSAPVESSKYLLEDSSWSPVLYDHKAVLFDHETGMLVIPGNKLYSDDVYWYRSVAVAYVFSLSVLEGISLRGVVTHDMVDVYGYDCMERALYIGDCLYTVSRSVVQANMIDDLSFVNQVVLLGGPDYVHY